MKVASLFVGALTMCSIIFLSTHALKNATIVRELVITTPNSATVALDQHLYTVSKNQTHVHINSTNVNDRPCAIAIDPFEDVIQGKMKVETTDREISIRGIQSQEIQNGTISTYYTLLLIDPWRCSYTSFVIPKSVDVKVPKISLPELTRYRYSLDVFFPNLKTCAPCRFENDGKRKYEFYRFEIEKNNYYSFYIRWMRPDFFFVQNFENDRAVLKYLGDDDFRTIRQKYINYRVETVAFKKGKFRNVGICSKHKIGNSVPNVTWYDEIRCEKLNSKLQSVVSMVIPIRDKEISSVSMEFDHQGNSFISFAEDNQLRVYVHNLFGQLLQSYDLGSVDMRLVVDNNLDLPFSYDSFSHWDVHGFLVGDQYCVVTEQVITDGYVSALHVVKCISVEKYINKSNF